jgi:hypothetical protein
MVQNTISKTLSILVATPLARHIKSYKPLQSTSCKTGLCRKVLVLVIHTFIICPNAEFATQLDTFTEEKSCWGTNKKYLLNKAE